LKISITLRVVRPCSAGPPPRSLGLLALAPRRETGVLKVSMGRPPFDERELTVLFAALLLAALSAYYQRNLRRVPHWRFLLAGVACLCVGSTATIVEHFVAYDAFNTIEHFAYFAQSLMLLIWALRTRQVPA
jgi:hypothetical protein